MGWWLLAFFVRAIGARVVAKSRFSILEHYAAKRRAALEPG